MLSLTASQPYTVAVLPGSVFLELYALKSSPSERIKWSHWKMRHITRLVTGFQVAYNHVNLAPSQLCLVNTQQINEQCV